MTIDARDESNASRSALVRIEKGCAVIRFNRPAQRNPLSISTLTELDRATSSLTPRSDIYALVFTGTDGVFAH